MSRSDHQPASPWLTTAILAALVANATPVAPAALAAQTRQDSLSVEAFYTTWFGTAPESPAAYASFYEPAGYIFPPGEIAVRGRGAIAGWLATAQLNAPYRTAPQGIEVEEMRFLGPDWVVHRSRLWGIRRPTGGGPDVPFETKYFDLLHRAGDTWQVAYRMWSDNAP